MRNTIALAVLAAAFAATPAVAQDNTAGSGVFVGAVIGYDRPTIDDGVDDYSSDGMLYGVTAGYDANVGGAILGAEIELTDSTAGTDEEDLFVAGDSASLDAALDLYVGGRVGFAAGENAVIYLKGGYTTGRVKLSYDDGVDAIEESDNLDGWRAGVGGEFDLGVLTTRVEYRYSNYGDYGVLGVDTGLSADRHQLAVILGKRF